jgi:hypothetical protein
MSTFSLASTDANNSNNNYSSANTTAWDIFLIVEGDSDEEDDDKGNKEEHKDYDPHVDEDAPLLVVDATTTMATMPTTQGHVLPDNSNDDDGDYDGDNDDNDDDKLRGLSSAIPMPLPANAPGAPSVSPKTGSKCQTVRAASKFCGDLHC